MVLIYATCADKDEARRIGRDLVYRRLAACINIFPAVESIFFWEGNLEQANEAVMVAKTVQDKVPEAIEVIRAGHSYSVPAILVLPVLDGNKAFIEWVSNEVGNCGR
ncbi:MAG: divalent-cation tolerance protein CutA [Bacillota bacterium]